MHADDRLAGGALRPARDDQLVGLRCSPSPRSCAAPPIRSRRWSSGGSCRAALGAPVIPLSQTILLDSFPQAAAGTRDLDLRHGGGDRPGDRPDPGRHAVGTLQLALGLLHDRAGRLPVVRRPAAHPAPRQAGRPHGARLDRLSLPVGHHRLHPARAVARPAARLVRLDARSCSRPSSPCWPSGSSSPTASRHGTVPQPAPAARPQLCARPRAGADLRHAELHADGAAAAAAAAACRLSRPADRRDHRRPRRRRHDGLLPGHLRRPHGSAHRPDRRLLAAGDLGPVADEHRSQCRHQRADGQQLRPGHRHRRDLGAAHAGHLLDRRLRQPGRGHGGLSPAAQHRLQLLHLDLRRRDRARHGRQLQPHGRAGEPLQQDAGLALGDRRLGLRHGPGTCPPVEGDQPPGGHAGLHQRLRLLHFVSRRSRFR